MLNEQMGLFQSNEQIKPVRYGLVLMNKHKSFIYYINDNDRSILGSVIKNSRRREYIIDILNKINELFRNDYPSEEIVFFSNEDISVNPDDLPVPTRVIKAWMDPFEINFEQIYDCVAGLSRQPPDK